MKYYVIRPSESRSFRQCRRAWDLGSRERQNYEPVAPTRVFDFDEAIHDAMDVYYFPGMWDWNRTIVRPLAVQGFAKSMRRQRTSYAEHQPITPEQEADWQRHLELGTDLLERYFGWALVADKFTSVQVAMLFDVTIPIPASPEDGLLTPDGRAIWYRVRADTVVVDEHERMWLVEHRVVHGEWSDLDQLLLDEPAMTRAWAWQWHFLVDIEGVIHNELQLGDAGPGDGPAVAPEVGALRGPSGLIKQERSEFFRRTYIPHSPDELKRRGLSVAQETIEMTSPGLAIYPNPSLQNCAGCDYREPCMAMTSGEDPQPILNASFRKRTAEDFEPGRLGSVYGFMPETPRIADYRNPPRPPGEEEATG